jgi:hypothetical protein
MRNLPRALLAGGLGFAVSLTIAACGGGAGLLSGNQANTLNNQLSKVSADLTAGHCDAARRDAQGLAAQVSSLPATVSAKLRQDLILGASTIRQLVPSQCRQVSAPAPTPSTTSSTTTSSTTSSTTPATTSSTTTTSTTQTPPPKTTPTSTTTSTTPSGGGGVGGGGAGGGPAGGGPGPGGGGPGPAAGGGGPSKAGGGG